MSVGHKRLDKHSHESDTLKQIVEHCAESCLLALVLGKRPGSGLVDVFVTALREVDNFLERVADVELLNLSVYPLDRIERKSLELVVNRLSLYRLLNNSAEVLLVHRDCAVNKISESVRKVGVEALNNRVIGYGAVAREGHFGKQIITDSVNADKL